MTNPKNMKTLLVMVMRGGALEEGATVEKKPTMVRRHWKRIVLSLAIVLILVGSLVYYVLPRVLYPLRRDSVPSGAYVVPWMQPHPYFGQISDPFSIDSVMADALKVNMTFRINMWNGTTRIIPSTAYLGHDSKYLYVGGKLVGMYSNPASEPYGDTQPNRFQMYFDVANDGVLQTPEAGSGFGVNIDVPQETLVGVQWPDMMWVYDPTNTYRHNIWMPADLYYETRGGATIFSMAAHAQEYDSSTGTITFVFARFLNRPGTEKFNALQMRPGERWTMGFLVELGYQKELDNRVDGWPRNIYPYLSDDSSWWPKLVIDLANPPANM